MAATATAWNIAIKCKRDHTVNKAAFCFIFCDKHRCRTWNMSVQTQQISTTDHTIAASTHPHDAGVFQWGGGADSALLHLIYYQTAENSGSQLKLLPKTTTVRHLEWSTPLLSRVRRICSGVTFRRNLPGCDCDRRNTSSDSSSSGVIVSGEMSYNCIQGFIL